MRIPYVYRELLPGDRGGAYPMLCVFDVYLECRAQGYVLVLKKA